MPTTKIRNTSAPPASLCVLLIEDDPLTQKRLEILIEALGHAVVSVGSAQQAREAMAAVFFPIVILDRILEDADGLSLCSEIRAHGGTNCTYLMLLSALDSDEEIASGMQAGADVYLSKRLSDAEVMQRLQSAAYNVRMSIR